MFTTALESDEIVAKVMPAAEGRTYEVPQPASRYALVDPPTASDVRIAVTGAGSNDEACSRRWR